MSSTTSKVLTGCGLGCLALVIISVALGWMGYRWAQDTVATVETATETQEELDFAFGRARDFIPPIDPGLPEDRMKVFLAVRESLTVPRNELAEAVAGLAPDGGQSGVFSGLRVATAGASIAPRALEFTRARNEILLAEEMGFGEYMWIYWMTYHALLGHPPGESELHQSLAERAADGGSSHVQFGGDLEPERMTWRLRRELLTMLRNLDEELADDPDREDWRREVEAEIAVVEGEPGRVPWQDGLPASVIADLEPFRSRLEESYSPATNIFELLVLD
jgi:hypothetical protein